MRWLRQPLARRRLERNLSDEIAQHLEEKVAELVAAGISHRDAVAAARRAFGNVTLFEERSREVWHWRWIEDLWADLWYAARQLRRTPAFAAAAILTLAMGIGLNTAVYSVVHAVVLRPLPFPEPERLVAVASIDARTKRHTNLSYYTFFDFRESGVFQHIASYRDTSLALTGRSVPVQLDAQVVSSDFFDVLGVATALGRGFIRADEDRGARVVILSHAVWTTHFGADPGIAGKSVSIDEAPHTIAGIAPPGFTFPIQQKPVDVWTTLARDASSQTVVPLTEQRGARVANAVARLRSGMSLGEAHARLDAVAASLAQREPGANKHLAATILLPELERVLGPARAPLLMLWGAVALVLLIACANIANMLLARTADREQELGVRLAIGGSRGRLVRQLLTENLLLAAIGGGAGVLVAIGTVRLVLPFMLESVPRAAGIRVDASVLAFTVALVLLTSVLVSIPTALWIRRIDANPARTGASRGGTDTHEGVRGALVVTQVSASLVLLTAACLLAAGFLHLTRRDHGFRPDGLISFSVALPDVRYSNEAKVQFMTQALERLNATAGVTSAVVAMPLPLTGNQMSVAFDIVGRTLPPSERVRSNMAIVTPGYFRTIGTPLLEGRDFTEDDDERHGRVMIVNKAFADRFFPGQRAIGKYIESGATSNRDAREGGSRAREIVGIVGNARQSLLGSEPEPIYYFPYKQMPWGPPAFVVRTPLPVASIEPELRRVVASLDDAVPVHTTTTLLAMLSSGMAGPRFLTMLMGSFAALALLLIATGLYGLLAYVVLRRTREIGVRLALGASRGHVMGMVLRRATLLIGVGVLIGGALAFLGQRVVRTMMFAPGEGDPGILLFAATAIVIVTAAAAASLPALRAASVDPVQALRND